MQRQHLDQRRRRRPRLQFGSGVLRGKILTPKTVANVTFGGPKRNWLFIAATDSVHLIHTKANGAQRP